MPPTDPSFLVTQLWDKHQPRWREPKNQPKDLSDDLKEALRKLTKNIEENSQPINPPKPISIADASFLTVKRELALKKGKWQRFPPEARERKL
jgi:hypothetical protein